MKIGFDFSTSFLWEIYKNWISASNKSPGPCPCIYFKRLIFKYFQTEEILVQYKSKHCIYLENQKLTILPRFYLFNYKNF